MKTILFLATTIFFTESLTATTIIFSQDEESLSCLARDHEVYRDEFEVTRDFGISPDECHDLLDIKIDAETDQAAADCNSDYIVYTVENRQSTSQTSCRADVKYVCCSESPIGPNPPGNGANQN